VKENGLRQLAPHERIAAVADRDSMAPVDAVLERPRPSPHLARWGIAAQEDDGVAVARATIRGEPVLIAAQDERFLRGSAGANHADALCNLFTLARAERPAAVVIVAASGGVRLHEANPAEAALARALAALLSLRAADVPVISLCVADTFGGASVLVCGAERTAMMPGARLGVSGPAVIETAHGRSEVDASDADAVAALFGAQARSDAGYVDLVDDDADAVRNWIGAALRSSVPFAASVRATQQRLAARLATTLDTGAHPQDTRATVVADLPPGSAPLYDGARPVDDAGWLWRIGDRWITRTIGAGTLGPREALGLSTAIIEHVAVGTSTRSRALWIVGDSQGHEASRRAELLCLSQYLAHLAAVIALVRSQGVQVRGALTDTGHSAAFFATALQADGVYALEQARVVAMEPAAIARVLGLPAAQIAALVEDDPLIGHPVRQFARWGSIAGVLPDAAALRARMNAAGAGAGA